MRYAKSSDSLQSWKCHYIIFLKYSGADSSASKLNFKVSFPHSFSLVHPSELLLSLAAQNITFSVSSVIIIIIIIQEISTAHDLELKARVQCAHRKNTEQITYKNKKTNKAHHNYHALDDCTIIQSTTAGKVDSPETTNCTSVHKRFIK